MVKKFIEEFAKLIIDFPQDLVVEEKILGDDFSEILIVANKSDTGKLIGKDGKMINSLKTVIGAYKAKNGISYRITVKAHGE